MEVNYNDERFKEVETDKKAALQEVEKTYGGMINDSDSYYKAQIDASKDWAKQQTQLQNEKTDFAIEQIEQQKEQAKKDYTKEQSGAYVDWQKQKSDYGTNAEKMAESGLDSTGFAESSQVSMYNTYQNRVMTARESYTRAVLNYDNAIKDARLQNNSALAEIAYNALQKQLELSLAGFQYKNQLLLDKFDKKTQTEDRFHQRYQDVLAQINTENALSEQIRQFNEQMALEREQFAWQKEQAAKAAASSSRSSGGSGRSGGSGGGGSGGGNSGRKVNPKSIETKETKKNGDLKVNAKSVISLGQGPRSGAWLDEQEEKGNISSHRVGNQIAFTKNKNSGIASKYLNLTGFKR